jgi:peroxiredoxin
MPHAMPPLDLRPFAAADAATGLAPGALAPNFRLTDHQGLTRELNYESGAKAVVLIFTAADSPRAVANAAAFRAFRSRFSASEVVIWQIDSNLGAHAATLAAEQTLHQNPLPVLLDEAQLVATEFGATRELETFVIAPGDFNRIVYRGPLDNADPLSSAAATESFAADAVAALLAGRAPAVAHRALSAAARPLDLPPAPAVNYATDVAPIVARRCLSCHSPGNIAPYPFTKYEDIVPRATALRASLLARRMSPWHADRSFGVFSNSAATTPAETAILHAWARAGAPRGTGTDPLPATPPPPSGDWPLGQPDLVVSIPRQDLPATGTIDYRYLTVAIPTPGERWLRAAVVRPGNRRVVHHALVFEGTLFDVLAAGGGLGGFFAGYVPGFEQTTFPAGTGKRLRAGSSVTFQMHYTASGQPESDETQLGFYFMDAPPERELLTRAASSIEIAIPPGAPDHPLTATFTPSATRDVMLYELNPHMHYRGKRVRFEALYPGGATEVLLNVPQYDFNWQSMYRLAQPKRLPAGTRIRVSGAFDNSPQNPQNPNPAASVRFGEQTDDEMFIGYLNYAELPARAAAPAPQFAGNLAARARTGQPFSLAVTAANSPTAYRATGLPAGLQLNATSGVLAGTPTAAGRHAIVVTAENAAGSAATVVDLAIAAAPTVPVVTRHPASVRTRIGGSATFAAAIDAPPGTIYTWFFRGGEFCNTDTPVLTLNDVTAGYVGEYYLVAATPAGSVRTAAASLAVDVTRLVNLSARANVGTGTNVVIPGITVRGTAPKSLLIRAAGPALTTLGVAGALANPILSVFTAAGEKILENDNWNDGPNVVALRATAAAQGAFALPENSRDAAMLVTLPPGGYTVQVAGLGTGTAAQGVAIVEVYEADQSSGALVNLSCRARVGTGGDILIAGFVVNGTASKRMLVRAIGPTLASLGVDGALADPRLEIVRPGAAVGAPPVAGNDNWDAALAPTFAAVGAFALTPGSRDAALVATLAPGAYTVQVSGVNNTTGVAIVEVYELP